MTSSHAKNHGKRVAITVFGAAAGFGLVAVAIGGRWDSVEHALTSTPLWALVVASVLQLASLVARSEAWHRCVRAAGGTVSRRVLYRAASVGYVGNLVNGELGFAMRIAAMKRSAPRETPKLGALATTEVPILLTELVLAFCFSFTLVEPLGWPWWIPVVLIAAMVGVTLAITRLRLGRRLRGWLSGLAVLRDPRARWRMAAVVGLAMAGQILRNWVVLHASGIDVSVLDATAVLIGVAMLGVLPLGPSTGAGATLLILGSHDIGAAAAAGLLLTATGALGALTYAGWAVADRGSIAAGHLGRVRADRLRTRRAEAGAASIRVALDSVPTRRRERLEATYFGGITRAQVARILTPFHAPFPRAA